VRALEIMGQVYVHIKAGNGVLFAAVTVPYHNRVADVFNAHLVYGDVPVVLAALDIRNFIRAFYYLYFSAQESTCNGEQAPEFYGLPYLSLWTI
jgi:hypothetical protein